MGWRWRDKVFAELGWGKEELVCDFASLFVRQEWSGPLHVSYSCVFLGKDAFQTTSSMFNSPLLYSITSFSTQSTPSPFSVTSELVITTKIRNGFFSLCPTQYSFLRCHQSRGGFGRFSSKRFYNGSKLSFFPRHPACDSGGYCACSSKDFGLRCH